MRVRVEVDGSRVIARLSRVERGLADLREPLTEAGAWLLVQLWDRITGRSTSVYSARYKRWLIKHGELSGKLVGLLTGDLIGQMAPGPDGHGGGSLAMELNADGESALVGLLKPKDSRGKAPGFSRWHKRKFGSPAIALEPGDSERIAQIFEEWMEDLTHGS